MEKLLFNLIEAERTIMATDHLIYVTFPLIKNKRLLLKAMVDLKNAIAKCINSILQYEYIFRRIRLSKDPKTNLETFLKKSAPNNGIGVSETRQIIELFGLVKKHEESPMEFVRKEKIVILSANLHKDIITLEDIKRFLILSKTILKKTQEIIDPKLRKI